MTLQFRRWTCYEQESRKEDNKALEPSRFECVHPDLHII